MSIDRMINLIRVGDVGGLRILLDQEPHLLKTPFSGFDSDGYALHCAAHYNQPEIIKFLVEEKGQDVNQQNGVRDKWTPLHEAKNSLCKSYAAAACLLMLGADPRVARKDGKDNLDFAQSAEVQAVFNPNYLKEKIEKEIKGTWKMTTLKEVVHVSKQTEQGISLAETFNFETRRCRLITKDLDTGNIAVETTYFDHIPDKTILNQAFQELKRLGGDVDEGAIKGRRSMGKGKLGLQRKNQCP